MADGLNQARAMRIAEIMSDYRNVQSYIASIRAGPSAEEYNEEGFAVLRRCVAEAQALLAQSFQGQTSPKRDEEHEKDQLRRILLDAAVRRFKAKKLYHQATAALRWINGRTQILQGQRARAGSEQALQRLRNNLRSELASITDERVELSLRTADARDGKWLGEDPGLSIIQRSIGQGSTVCRSR